MKSVRGILIMVLLIICVISGFISISSIVSKKQDEAAYESLCESVTASSEPVTTESEPLTEQSEEIAVKPTESSAEETTSAASSVPAGVINLMKQNANVVGWIKIDNTKIDYPIVQHKEDNEYFLHRDINGKKNSAGSIYLDSNHQIDGDGLHVVYGHHMKNGSMFKDIVKFRDAAYMKQHQNITIWTGEREISLKPVYCYAGAADGSYRNNFDSPEELQAFLKEKTGETISSDNVFVFITCSYGSADERTYLICEEEG
ncbi:class B sortase [Clostridium porci]|nr:class B sortase [Clostridium porci]